MNNSEYNYICKNSTTFFEKMIKNSEDAMHKIGEQSGLNISWTNRNQNNLIFNFEHARDVYRNTKNSNNRQIETARYAFHKDGEQSTAAGTENIDYLYALSCMLSFFCCSLLNKNNLPVTVAISRNGVYLPPEVDEFIASIALKACAKIINYSLEQMKKTEGYLTAYFNQKNNDSIGLIVECFYETLNIQKLSVVDLQNAIESG